MMVVHLASNRSVWVPSGQEHRHHIAACKALWDWPRKRLSRIPHEITCGTCRRTEEMRRLELEFARLLAPTPAEEPSNAD